MAQDKQQKSVTSHDRKDRILDALFTKRIETITLLNLFRGLLSVFQGYVKKFQAEVPQIHILHEQMVDITKTFLAMFIKPEHIPDNVSALVKLDVSDRSIQKTDRDLAVGIYAQSLITKARMDKAQRHWLELLFMNLRTGYVSAATKILQLPMKNKTIRCLSALDPELHGHSQVSAAFRYLANLLPNVVSGDEEGSLAMELNNYNVDRQVKAICEDFDDGKRVDLGFWSKVAHLKTFDNQRYPVLSKLVFAMLTIFSGPLVEGTFNVMGDIIEEDRTRMNIENYEAVAIVKTALKRKAVKASALKVTPSMKRCCIHAYSSYKQHIKLKKQMQEERKQEQLNESISKLKQEKAKRFAKLLKLRQRTLQRKSVAKKRPLKTNDSATSTSRQWKRIKLVD
ncbi:uncharacterized protein LOC128550116 [Mercenaria mercenaria]|uniref:uncharacterized protein LOC128550116 n=1 Tax=Mercenaria mercenaria TaxID=6596 RepID=UPI00234E5BE5|nr:uncharacterized protein LOC128550116 [Mercenaria mercenaria]